MGFSKFLTGLAVLLLVHSSQSAKIATTTTKPPTTTTHPGGKISHGSTTAPPTLGTGRGLTGANDIKADISPSPSPDPYDPSGSMCDIWAQDCPPGFKCISDDLDSEPRCRTLENGADSIGEECSTKFENDGDTCESDGMCINGVCRELCHGTPASPICDHADVCHIYADGTPLCEDKCDPYIWQICGAGKYCTQDSTSPNGMFTCMLRPEFDPQDPVQLGTSGKSCVETSQCEQGFACIEKTYLPNGFCHNGSTLKCCTPLAEDPKDCPNGMVLVDYYQNPPPSYEHVKVCALYGGF